MKSCLKLTPPLTPQSSSYANSPVASGSSSPVLGASPLPPLARKTVSFCDDQEFYEADDWDRSPAPVAPKLGYQEILELKQIMKSLPLAPQYSSYRQHFTTSIPQSSPSSSSSTSSTPFPISRFATMPSATPSKWKNRDASREVDREILPYLDSVPIQLLPLLPPSPQTSNSSALSSSHTNPNESATPTSAGPIKPPISQPIGIPTPMLTPPPSLASSTSSSPRSSSPTSSSVSSSLTSTASTTPRHFMKFQIVPLLPVQEVVKPPPPPPAVTAPPKVAKKFNMTFVPLLPPEEPVQLPTPTQATITEAAELTPQNETPPEREDEASHPEDDDLDSVHSPSSDYVPFNGPRSYNSTPSLSSASDTDTESETPSVSSPGPSSPFDDDTLPGYFAPSTTLSTDVPDAELLEATADVGSNARSTLSEDHHNPYFPPIPTSAQQTPRAATAAYDLADILKTKGMSLHAMPSPALLPPSPFSLYPGEDAESCDTVEPELRGDVKSATCRRPFARRSSVLSQASDSSPGTSPIPTIETLRNIPLKRVDSGDGAFLKPSLSRKP